MPKTYKILLSAYACEPNKGSEPGVGWHWALEIVKRGHEVWVITRKNNKATIDNYFSGNKQPANLHFCYYDLPFLFIRLKKVIGVNLYYLFWQLGIVSYSKKLNHQITFDLIHHITFGVFRHPSFLTKLNVPLVFGPVGGGEEMTKKIKSSIQYKYRLIETLRESINLFAKFNPFQRLFYNKTSIIYTKTSETKSFIPQKYHTRTKVLLEIGINQEQINTEAKTNECFTLLFAGRLIYWKGVKLAFESYDHFRKQTDGFNKFVLIGKGEYQKPLLTMIKQKKLESNVILINWIEQDKLKTYYQSSHVFLFPSLHDSSGNVVLEALAQGLPVICLDLGGPGQIVNNTCGRVIKTAGKTESELIVAISEAITELKENPDLRQQLSEGAIRRANEFTWEKTVGRVYDEIEAYMENKPSGHE